MKYIDKYYNNRSIKTKMILFFILIIFITVFVIAFLVSNYFVNTFLEKQIENELNTINQIQHNLEKNISDLEDISFYLYSNENVVKFLRGTYLKQDEVELVSEVENLLKMYQGVRKDIGGMLLARHDGSYISNDMICKPNKDFTNDYWFKEAIENPNTLTISNKPIDRNVKSLYDYYSADNMISVSIAIGDGPKPGVLLIDLKSDYIKDIIFEEDNDSGFYFLVDNDFNILFAPLNKIAYRINHKVFEQDIDNNLEFNYENNAYKIIYSYSSFLDNYLVSAFPLSPLKQATNKIVFQVSLVGLIVLIFAIICAFIFTSSYTKPIFNLINLMKEVERGNLDIRFDSKYNDEIGQLGDGFDSMILSLNDYLERIKLEQQGKKEADLRAFQMQIKPHFLYNTLDTVKWIALEHKIYDIVEIISSLSTFFRIGLNNEKDLITLEEEILHLESYLSMQLIRYKDKFTYCIYSDEEIRYTKVFKLLLQPIVENSIYHGIKPKEGSGHIDINIAVIDNTLIYEVIDDGVGLSEKEINDFNRYLSNSESIDSKYGIGISNVNNRIKLKYGTEYGVRFEQMNKGLKVIISQPYYPEEGVCTNY